MKIVLKGLVHSCAQGTFPVVVNLGGKDVAATVNGVVLEVVGESRSFTLDLAGQDLAEAQEAFPAGKPVTLTLEAE